MSANIDRTEHVMLDLMSDRLKALAKYDELAAELKVTDELLALYKTVLEAVPPCPLHGETCVSHALDWIKEAKEKLASWADEEYSMNKTISILREAIASRRAILPGAPLLADEIVAQLERAESQLAQQARAHDGTLIASRLAKRMELLAQMWEVEATSHEKEPAAEIMDMCVKDVRRVLVRFTELTGVAFKGGQG